jgi:hypothetical protein
MGLTLPAKKRTFHSPLLHEGGELEYKDERVILHSLQHHYHDQPEGADLENGNNSILGMVYLAIQRIWYLLS